jgi:hypothetical protein
MKYFPLASVPSQFAILESNYANVRRKEGHGLPAVG